MNIYYVYQYLREDMTPYYIGKGKGDRLNRRHKVGLPPKERRVIIADNLLEQEAFDLEIKLITKYGRKDLGTGILRNQTNGGDGASGTIHSAETRAKRSKSCKGRKGGMLGKSQSSEQKEKVSAALKGKPKSEEHKRKISEAMKGKVRSAEHSKNLSIANKAYWANKFM